MSLPSSVSKASCRDDISLKKQSHKVQQRYMDPDTGRCTELVVQAVKPASGPGIKQVRITDQTRRIPKLVVSLFRPKDCSPTNVIVFVLLWPFRFLICSIHLLFWPLDGLPKGGMGGGVNVTEYPPYLMYYWGQLWAARSQKEHSAFEKAEEHPKDVPPRAASNCITRLLRRRKLEDDLPSTPPVITSPPESTAHGFYPRRLVIARDDDHWEVCDDHDKIARHRYFAVTYRQSDILKHGKEDFIASIHLAASQCKMKAYWLDLECMGDTEEEKHLDVYQMADIYRGAEFTVVVLPKSGDPTDAQSREPWRNWSNRVWTLPEILLSKELRYMVGPEGPVTMVTLRELANFAYGHDSKEAAVVNACAGMGCLYRLEHLTFLKTVMWRRGTPSQDPEKAPPKAQSRRSKGIDDLSYEAEKVYALMAFFEHRIMPFPSESDLHALARLSMINDEYRIAERMLSMFPHDIPSKSCWYADNDQYKAQFWDIEPEVQVAGVTDKGALVLDGCRAASIRWKDFPEVGVQTTGCGSRQLVAKIAVFGIPSFYAYAAQWIPWLWSKVTRESGDVSVDASGSCSGSSCTFKLSLSEAAAILAVVLFGWATILLTLGPFMIAYSISGRILFTQPFLIGVKGALKVEEASHYLYRAWLVRPRLAYTASGSVLAEHAEEGIREGNLTQYDKVKEMDDLYTLVDTSTGTLYYFTAKRPPTVCLYTGREGGLGRFVLCSENCTANELHKETVLRMPSQIHRSMRSCGWLAIGGAEE